MQPKSGYSANYLKTVNEEEDVVVMFESVLMINQLPDSTYI